MEISEWKEHLRAGHEQKNAFFKMHFQSPLLSAERQNFKELDYYPPDPDYRLELQLQEHKEKKNTKGGRYPRK